MKTLRRLAIAALIGLICFGVMITLKHTTSFLDRFEWRTYDLRFQRRVKNPQPTDPNIVLIGIDDTTRQIFPWTMGRVWHADLLKHLSDVLPMVVGYDILFKEKTQDIFGKAAKATSDAGAGAAADADEESAIMRQAEKWDEKFRTNLMLLDPPPVLAYNFIIPEEQGGLESARTAEQPTEQELAESWALLHRFEITNVTGPLDRLPEGIDPSLPDPLFAEVSQLGFINAPWDPDGVRRRLPMLVTWRVTDPASGAKRVAVFPSLTLLMVANYLQVDPGQIEVEVGKEIRIPAKDKTYIIPTDEKGQLLVNFAGPTTKAFEAFSFAQVLNWGLEGRTDQLEQFADKMVFVGEMGTGTVDTKPTPLGEETELVAMHLNAANSILRQEFVRMASPAACTLILLASCLVTAVVSAGTSPRTSLLAATALFFGYGLVVWRIFNAGTLVLPMVAPMVGIVHSFAVVIFYRYLTEERQKLWIRRALGRYLSPNIMREVLENPKKLALGGERRKLTVLFSDIRSFTPFCESHEPEVVVASLNEYLDQMTKRIFEHSGTLDKYVGDEIVAFYGAPGQEHADHALNAARSALAMKATLAKLQEKWRAEGRAVLDFGVGLNTGEMLVGNMGSTALFDYTVIGDQVNLGARVEALTRTYGCHIIITESTLKELGNLADTRFLGEETVKGKTRPIKVYELVGLREAQTSLADAPAL
jgi:adenylate cyclase